MPPCPHCRIANLEAAVEQHRNEIEEWQNAATAKEKRLAELEAEVERLRRERDEAMEEVDQLHDAIDEHLPTYGYEDGSDDIANAVETIGYAGGELKQLRRERDEALAKCPTIPLVDPRILAETRRDALLDLAKQCRQKAVAGESNAELYGDMANELDRFAYQGHSTPEDAARRPPRKT